VIDIQHALFLRSSYFVSPLDNQATIMELSLKKGFQDYIALFKISENSFGKRSTLIPTQDPIRKYYYIIGELTVVDIIQGQIVNIPLI
jgi:hypothetical protein